MEKASRSSYECNLVDATVRQVHMHLARDDVPGLEWSTNHLQEDEPFGAFWRRTAVSRK